MVFAFGVTMSLHVSRSKMRSTRLLFVSFFRFLLFTRMTQIPDFCCKYCREKKKDELEKQLSEIQQHLHAKSKGDGKTGLDAIDLQQQVSDLRNSLAQVIQQNQELETSLTQKQLELEQRDRVMREQSKFLKARNELLTVLKGKQQTSVDNPPNENYEDMDEVMS